MHRWFAPKPFIPSNQQTLPTFFVDSVTLLGFELIFLLFFDQVDIM